MCSGILYARVCTKSLQSCQTLCDPVDCSLPASLSMGFSRQEYWSGLPFPLQEIFLTQELNLCLLCLPALATGFFPTSAAWEAQWYLTRTLICISFLPRCDWQRPRSSCTATTMLQAPQCGSRNCPFTFGSLHDLSNFASCAAKLCQERTGSLGCPPGFTVILLVFQQPESSPGENI